MLIYLMAPLAFGFFLDLTEVYIHVRLYHALYVLYILSLSHQSRDRLADLVAEHLDHLHYLNDILCLNIDALNDVLTDQILNRLLIPLYVYSLTMRKRAADRLVRLQQGEGWGGSGQIDEPSILERLPLVFVIIFGWRKVNGI